MYRRNALFAAAATLLWSLAASAENKVASSAEVTRPLPPDLRGTASQPFVVATFESSEDAAAKAEERRNKQEEQKNARWTVALTGAAVLVAAAQGAFFIWQLILMRRTVADTSLAAKAAQESAEIAKLTMKQTRAYLSSPGMKAEWEVPDKKLAGYHFSPFIQNTGSSPALKAITYVDRKVVPAADVDSVCFEWKEPLVATPTTIAPTSGGNCPTGAAMRITRDEMIAVFNGTTAIVLHVRCNYEDVFGDKHHFEQTWRLGLKWDPRKHDLKSHDSVGNMVFWVIHNHNNSAS